MSNHLITIIFISLFTYMASAGTIFSNFKTPEPNWTLCHSYDHFEVRQYEPMIWASIKVNEKEYNKAFMSLAKYIWGENHLPTDPTKSEKINMMVPVFQHSSNNNIMMSFVMPPKYKTVEEVPIPNNPMIQIHLMDPLIVFFSLCCVFMSLGRRSSIQRKGNRINL